MKNFFKKLFKNEKRLLSIALCDKDWRKCAEALRKLDNQSYIALVALCGKDWRNRGDALKKLDNQSYIALVALCDKDWRNRGDALKKLYNQSYIALVALCDKDWRNRGDALNKLETDVLNRNLLFQDDEPFSLQEAKDRISRCGSGLSQALLTLKETLQQLEKEVSLHKGVSYFNIFKKNLIYYLLE